MLEKTAKTPRRRLLKIISFPTSSNQPKLCRTIVPSQYSALMGISSKLNTQWRQSEEEVQPSELGAKIASSLPLSVER